MQQAFQWNVLTSKSETKAAAYDDKCVHPRLSMSWHLLCAIKGPAFRYIGTLTPPRPHLEPKWSVLKRDTFLALSCTHTFGWIAASWHLQQHTLFSSVSCPCVSLWPWLHGWNHGVIGCPCWEWREGGMCLYWEACGAGTCWCSPICGLHCWDGGWEEEEVEGVAWGKGMAMRYGLWQWRYFWGENKWVGRSVELIRGLTLSADEEWWWLMVASLAHFTFLAFFIL